jgi:hypothetical protein
MLVASASGTVTTVFLLVVLALGYIVLWAIWHFWFRKADDGDEPPGEGDPAPRDGEDAGK